MKKIFICLLTCLLLTQIYVIDTFADSSTIYESDDFEIDRIYHFKAGDSIKFSDGDIFDISIIDENRKTVVPDIYEYVFESDLNAYIYNYSVENYRYIRLHKTYDITYNLMGHGDNFVSSTKSYYYDDTRIEFWAFLPPVPTAKNYMFDGWYKEVDLINKIDWDSSGEYRVYGDTEIFAKWIKLTLTCIEAKDEDDTKIQIVPIAENQRVYDVESFAAEDRPVIGAREIKYDGTLIKELCQIEYDENDGGYFYTYDFDDDNEHILEFYVIDNETINTNYVVDSIDVEATDVLANDAYPWGSDFGIKGENYEVSLNTKLNIEADSVKYQWQVSNDNAIFENIPGEKKENIKIKVNKPEEFKPWYRCVVTYKVDNEEYKCISKPVELLDSRNLKQNMDKQYGALYHVSKNRNIDGILDGLYVSNDASAYILDSDKQYFNVLGKYNNGLKNYWISCSCDAMWAIYQKDENGYVSPDNIKNIICSFDSNNNVVFNVDFKNKVDAAIYTDTCIGRFPEIYYADGAAMKANLDSDNKLQSIHMVANNNFADANLNDFVGFTFTPVSEVNAFNIDAYLNGPYNNVDEGKYEYIINDYNNEDNLTFEQIFEILKDSIFDYCHGINYDTYSGGNDPFVYRTIDGKKTVVAIRSKDSVLSVSYKNIDSLSFKMNISNAINLGIDNKDINNIKPDIIDIDDDVEEVKKPIYLPPKTGIN